MPKYFASIAAVFKNETHILIEWIETHMREGIDHFFLIDNDSNDNPLEVLQDYIEKGLVTYIFDNTPHAQAQLYNKHILPKQHDSSWWFIIDLDEFVYAPSGNVCDFLKSLPDEVGSIAMPWVNFGSNSHVQQPPSVVKSFRLREDLETRKTWSINCKCVVRGGAVQSFGVHHSQIQPNFRYIDSNRNNSHYTCALCVCDEYHISCGIRLNHYCVQSWEWFEAIKMTRGDACSAQNGRNKDYFDQVNARCNIVQDDALYLKYQELYDRI